MMGYVLGLLRAYLPELLALLVFGLLLLFNVSYFDTDTYAELFHLESAKEMLYVGQWSIPLFNRQEYLIRPPIWTWVVLSFFKTFGVSVWAARIPAILLSMGGLVFTYLIAGFLFQSRVIACFAALTLATMWGYFYQSQLSTADIMATVVSLGFIWAFLQWHPMSLRRHGVKHGEKAFAIAFGALLGIMLLLKGPVGMLLMLVVPFLHLYATKTIYSIESLHWKPFWTAFVLVAMPWLILVSVQTGNPWFILSYLFEQPWQRLVSTGPWTILHHDFLFYIKRLGGMIFPYTVLLPVMFFDNALLRKMTPSEHGWLKLLLVWFLSGLVVYSLHALQEPSLLLPFYPPLAIMLGYYMGQMVEARDATPAYSRAISFYIIATMIGAVLTTIFTLHVLPDDYVGNYWRLPGDALLMSINVGIEIPLSSPFPIWKLWLLPAPFILIAGGIVMFLLMATRRPQLTGLTLALTSLLFLLFVKAIYLPVTYRPVPAYFASILNKKAKPQDDILLYSRHPDVKRMLFYLKPELNGHIQYVTVPETLSKVLVDPPVDKTIYGVMHEGNFYALDYAYRQNLRIDHADWKWDNRKLKELWRFLRIQQPIFDNMKFHLLLFQTLPQNEPMEALLNASEFPRALKDR